jgi:hypothetical protein
MLGSAHSAFWNWSMLLQIYPCLMLGSAHSIFWSGSNIGSPASSLERLSTTRRLQNYKKQVSKRQWQFSHLWNPITGTMEWWREYQNRSQTCNKLMKVKCCVCTTLIATHYWHLNEPALQLPDSWQTILNWGKHNNPIKHGQVQKLCYQTQFSKANFSCLDTNRKT